MNTSFGIARRPAMALQFQCVAVALVLGLFSPASLWAADGERTVVLLFDGPSEYNDALSSLFREELESHAGANHALRFEASLCADWTAEGIEQMVQDAVASKAGLIIALGVGASQQLSAERGDGRTLRFAPFFIDASWQELHNASRLATLAWPFSIPTALQSFIELGGTGQAPNLQEVGGTGQAPNRQEVGGTGQAPNRQETQRIGVLVPRYLLELLPPPPLDDWSQALDVELQLVAFDPDSADTLASEWAGKLDGLYLLPLWQLDEAAQRKLLDELSSQKLATFSHLGMDLVERGALAGLYAQSELERVAKRVAIDVSRALDGEDVAAFETQLLAARPRLTLNLATARKLELRTSWELLDQAELMHQDPPAYDGSISLAQAMQEVLASPVLAASRMEVELRRADVDALEGRLWPSIELGLNARVIDADRATNLANEPEFKGTVYAELEQLIYSDRVWTGLEQKEELVAIEDAGLLEEQLDWRLKAATVYLNVLQARGLVEIRREALRRSRSNLELARLRVEAGSANEADVYRWEIMLLQSQQELREAKALEQQARIGLNLLLGRPAEAFYDIEELGLEAPEMITSLPGFLERLGTPQDFELFRDYLVEQALGQAPELRKLDAAVAIKEAETARLSRSYWLPELGLQAGVSAHFLRAGEGSEPLELDITLPPPLDTMIPGDLVPDDLFPQPDAFEWFVGFGASWALWEGGAREQAFDQTELELMQLQSQRAALHLKLEQEVRAALIDAGASYPKIASTQEALVSAHAALELVTDAYRRGAVTVAELVDAQNAASTVESAAAIAVYAFLIDVLEVERAMGRFSIDLDVLQKQAWLEQMNQYFDAREATP